MTREGHASNRRLFRPSAEPLEARELLRPGVRQVVDLVPIRPEVSRQSATIEVRLRRRDARYAAQVAFATDDANALAGGDAVAGTHYQSVQQIVTFQPGEAAKTVSVPILPGASEPGEERVGLLLGQGPPAAGLRMATVTIVDRDDVDRPRIIKARQIIQRGGITGFELTFSEPLDPVAASDRRNFGLKGFDSTADEIRDLILFASAPDEKAFPLRLARHDPASNTVTLIPTRPLKLSGSYEVVVNPASTRRPRARRPAPPSLIDLAGNHFGDETVSLTVRREPTYFGRPS